MPESYKRLGAIAPADDKEYLVYTTPDATQSLLSNITVTNRSSSSATFDINVYRAPYTEYTSTGSTVRIEVGQDGLTEIRDTYDFDANGNALGFYYSGSVPQSHIDAILGVQSGDTITTFDGTNTYTFTATGAGQVGTVANYLIPGGTGEAGYMQDSGDYADLAGKTATSYGVTQQSDIDNNPNELFISAVRSSQVAALSSDGTTWSFTTLPISSQWIASDSGNDKIVVISGNISSVSTDGISWSYATLPTSSYVDVVYGNGVFVAVPYFSAQAAYSTDGITWSSSTMPTGSGWFSSEYGNNVFVVVAKSAAAASSTDGITWTARTMPSAISWQSTVYGNGVFVSVAGGLYGSAAAASSTDGITWTARTLPSSQNWSYVTYGNGVFVAIAQTYSNSDAAAYSTDGITWAASTLPSSKQWDSVAYGNGVFVAVSYYSSNTSAISTDGVTWTAGTLPSNENWNLISTNTLPYSSPSLNNLYKSSLISANETQILEPGIALSASASIVAKDNSGGNLTFSTYGVELS